MSKNSSKVRHNLLGQRSCPYNYEITKDGRLVIEGEDFGIADECFQKGEQLGRMIRLWNDISISSV